MKKLFIVSCFLLLLLLNGFNPYYENSAYTPVFMLRSELEKGIRLEGPREMKVPGKIYLKDNLIFISEKYYGIHVIDNTNAEHPVKKAFIRIDGCVDLAMKNNALYADNAVDLVSVKLNQAMTSVEVTSRIKNVFPELPSPDGWGLSYKENLARPEDAIIVRWDKKNK